NFIAKIKDRRSLVRRPKWRIGNRPSLLPTMQFCQVAPDLAFAVAYFFRDVNLSDHIKIAALARGAGQTAFAQAKPLPPLRAWRNFQAHVALESGHDQVSAQHCLPRLDLHLVNQIAAFDCDHDVGLDIRTALGRCLAPAKPAESGTPTAAAEKCFEKVAESCSVELKLNSATITAPLMKSTAGLLSLPLPVRWWLEAARA